MKKKSKYVTPITTAYAIEGCRCVMAGSHIELKEKEFKAHVDDYDTKNFVFGNSTWDF